MRPDGRVVARADGRPIWFESDDADLRPAGEAFGGLLLLPAMSSGADLELEMQIDSRWRANLARAARIVADWWGYEEPHVSVAGDRAAGPRATGRMLCFTGGVDSFHTLLTGPVRPDALVFAAGFDVSLTEATKLAAVDAALRSVATAAGIRAIALRTNLRRHRTFRQVPWNRSHGTALAALGHLLAGEYGTLVTSSTFSRDDRRPWGSDWRLDPYWSASDLEVVHEGADVPREQKLREIAGNPLVQNHLRVCWNSECEELNCGRCDKCVATMVILVACGQLERFATFPDGAQLHERLDDLATTRYLKMHARLLAAGLPAPVDRALARLLDRSA